MSTPTESTQPQLPIRTVSWIISSDSDNIPTEACSPSVAAAIAASKETEDLETISGQTVMNLQKPDSQIFQTPKKYLNTQIQEGQNQVIPMDKYLQEKKSRSKIFQDQSMAFMLRQNLETKFKQEEELEMIHPPLPMEEFEEHGTAGTPASSSSPTLEPLTGKDG